MKDIPHYNYPLFDSVSERLRDHGHRVYNPAEFPHDGPPENFPIRTAFAAYSSYICLEADTIVLLPKWQESLGVRAEFALASICKLDIFEWSDIVDLC